MIRAKSKLSDIHIEAIGRILAYSSNPENRLKSFFYLVNIDYVSGNLACCVLRLIDNKGTLEEIKQLLPDNPVGLEKRINLILVSHENNKLAKIRDIL